MSGHAIALARSTVILSTFTLSTFTLSTLTLLACATPTYAQSVAVLVNGEPITNYDIEQRSKLDLLSTHKQSTRQEVIEELINEKVKIKEAKQFGVDPSVSDIDASFADMSSRMRITPDQLSKSLESQGIRPDTLKQRIKADMVWTALVRGRYKESLQVGEKEVDSAARSQGDASDPADDKDKDKPTKDKPTSESFEYRMQPIVLIVPRGSAPAVTERPGQGSRDPAWPGAELRRGQHIVQVDVECRDPRHRDQDLGRYPGLDS